MKKFILALVIIAVVSIIVYKSVGNRPTENSSPAVTSPKTEAVAALYLFHNPQDQDKECRQIYSFVDRAERELAGRIEVKRPDVKAEKALVDKFQVRVLPTILIVSSTGDVQERFEGEGDEVASRIENALTRLKETKQ